MILKGAVFHTPPTLFKRSKKSDISLRNKSKSSYGHISIYDISSISKDDILRLKDTKTMMSVFKASKISKSLATISCINPNTIGNRSGDIRFKINNRAISWYKNINSRTTSFSEAARAIRRYYGAAN